MPGESPPVEGTFGPANRTEKINDVRRVDYNIEDGNVVSYNPYSHIEITIGDTQ